MLIIELMFDTIDIFCLIFVNVNGLLNEKNFKKRNIFLIEFGLIFVYSYLIMDFISNYVIFFCKTLCGAYHFTSFNLLNNNKMS